MFFIMQSPDPRVAIKSSSALRIRSPPILLLTPLFDSLTYYIGTLRAMSISIMRAQQIDVPLAVTFSIYFLAVSASTIVLFIPAEATLGRFRVLAPYSALEILMHAINTYLLAHIYSVHTMRSCVRTLNTPSVLHVIPLYTTTRIKFYNTPNVRTRSTY